MHAGVKSSQKTATTVLQDGVRHSLTHRSAKTAGVRRKWRGGVVAARRGLPLLRRIGLLGESQAIAASPGWSPATARATQHVVIGIHQLCPYSHSCVRLPMRTPARPPRASWRPFIRGVPPRAGMGMLRSICSVVGACMLRRTFAWGVLDLRREVSRLAFGFSASSLVLCF